MVSYPHGIRVYAIRDMDGSTIHLFGFGVYEGDFFNGAVGGSNPRIKLDNGQIVWGAECWWGPEEVFAGIRIGNEVVDVDIERSRRQEPPI